jgi:transcriptional regulator with XRE-family HTH domain
MADQAPHPDETPREDAAALDPTHGIGERLARLRGGRGVKVSGLAREIGVSPSLISQIERGQSRPSVTTLFAMAQALDVPVDALFRDAPPGGSAAAPATRGAPAAAAAGARVATTTPPERGRGRPRYLVTRAERDVLEIEGGVRWESLTPTPLDELEFLELVYEAHAESSPRLYRHPGQESALVLSGRLDIHVGFERYELGPGDSIHFPSSLPHRYVNPTDEVARAVTVILHDGDRGPSPADRRV